MGSKIVLAMLFAFAAIQLSNARKYCEYDIDYSGNDPEIILTEIRQIAYREYVNVRIEIESMECETSSSRCDKKRSLLSELEAARYQLDEYLIELNGSILKRMKKAYLKCKCTGCPEYKTIVEDIWRETESQVQPYILEFRKGFTKCRSFVGKGTGGDFKTPGKGKFGSKGKSTTKTRQYFEYEIDYVGDDPEIVLNGIRRRSYREYESVRIEMEKMKCESSRSEQKRKLLAELETTRYQLDEFLIELNGSILKRMKKAYHKHKCISCVEYKNVVADIWREAELQAEPHILEFRKKHGRCKSFLSGTVDDVQTMTRGLLRGTRV